MNDLFNGSILTCNIIIKLKWNIWVIFSIQSHLFTFVNHLIDLFQVLYIFLHDFLFILCLINWGFRDRNFFLFELLLRCNLLIWYWLFHHLFLNWLLKLNIIKSSYFLFKYCFQVFEFPISQIIFWLLTVISQRIVS
jgi:hypothetical protein